MDVKNIIKSIVKINRQTKEGKIEWSIVYREPSSLRPGEQLIDQAYAATILNTLLRIYKYKYKFYIEEDIWDWTEDIRLEMADPGTGRSLWAIPTTREVIDLYDTVRYKTSGFESFIDRFLSDEEKETKDDLPF